MYDTVLLPQKCKSKLSFIHINTKTVQFKMSLRAVWWFFIIYFMLVNLTRSEHPSGIWNKTLNNSYWKLESLDLSNLTIDVLVHKLDPYLEMNSNTLNLGGFLGDTWNILRETLRFKSNFKVVRFKKGRELIEENKADVFLGALVYTEETTNMIFSQPYFRNWYHLYFKLPEGKPADYLHFKTINAKLWLYILVFFKLLTVTLWFSCVILHKLVPKTERSVLSISTFYLAVVASFLNTGYDLKLRSFTARLVILLALIFGVLCYYALSASLVASLAVLDRSMPFSNFNEISEKKTHSLCMRNITFVYDSFTDSRHTLLPQWKPVINNDKCPNDMVDWKNIPKALCQDKVAILENRIIMSWVLQRVTCPVTLLPQRYFDTGNYIVFSKKFDQRKSISVMMLRMRSAGISRKLETKWIRNHVQHQPTTGVNQITFSHITGLLTIYSLMIGISLCILCVEILFHYYYDQH